MSLRARLANHASNQELQAYNYMVRQNQDEAFSLAYDLLGEEDSAVAIVQQAFINGFTAQKDAHLPFRLRALRWVVRACLDRNQTLLGPSQLDPRLARLSNEEKVVLVLVDRLGLDYSQAAGVTGISVANIQKILAMARFNLCK
jgi:DNA-directed RNA polymerase specialized sigma24 family protein